MKDELNASQKIDRKILQDEIKLLMRSFKLHIGVMKESKKIEELTKMKKLIKENFKYV